MHYALIPPIRGIDRYEHTPEGTTITEYGFRTYQDFELNVKAMLKAMDATPKQTEEVMECCETIRRTMLNLNTRECTIGILESHFHIHLECSIIGNPDYSFKVWVMDMA